MAEVPTITIDLDAKCPRCKKPGAANGGWCLDCRLKAIKARHTTRRKK